MLASANDVLLQSCSMSDDDAAFIADQSVARRIHWQLRQMHLHVSCESINATAPEAAFVTLGHVCGAQSANSIVVAMPQGHEQTVGADVLHVPTQLVHPHRSPAQFAGGACVAAFVTLTALRSKLSLLTNGIFAQFEGDCKPASCEALGMPVKLVLPEAHAAESRFWSLKRAAAVIAPHTRRTGFSIGPSGVSASLLII